MMNESNLELATLDTLACRLEQPSNLPISEQPPLRPKPRHPLEEATPATSIHSSWSQMRVGIYADE